MIDGYKQHCTRALDIYGEHVFATLSSRKHFHEWLRDQKGKDPTSRGPGILMTDEKPNRSNKKVFRVMYVCMYVGMYV